MYHQFSMFADSVPLYYRVQAVLPPSAHGNFAFQTYHTSAVKKRRKVKEDTESTKKEQTPVFIDLDEKRKRRSSKVPTGQTCKACGTADTPEWRRGPDNQKTLCNACGLHYAKLKRKAQDQVQQQPEINWKITKGSIQDQEEPSTKVTTTPTKSSSVSKDMSISRLLN